MAAAVDDDETRKAAIGRVLDHYLQTAHAADRLLYPARDPVTITPPRPGVTPGQLTEIRQALDWLQAERRVLLAAVPLATDNGFDACAWQLSWTVAEFLGRQGLSHEQTAVQDVAVAAAERLGDTRAQAILRRLQGVAYARTGDYEQGRAALAGSLGLYQQLGDSVGEARVHQNLGWIAERTGRQHAALDHSQQALRLLQAAGHRSGQADALNNVGWYHALLGDDRQARAYCRQSLALHRELGNRRGEASAWDSLGYVGHQLGRLADAIDCYQHALALVREVGDRHSEADYLIRLGDAHDGAGSPCEARDAWQQALQIFDSLRHHDVGKARRRLLLLPPSAADDDARAAVLPSRQAPALAGEPVRVPGK